VRGRAEALLVLDGSTGHCDGSVRLVVEIGGPVESEVRETGVLIFRLPLACAVAED